MTLRISTAVLVAPVVIALSGCVGGTPEPISSAEYHSQMESLGKFGTMSESNQDSVGQALCGDYKNLDKETRQASVLVLEEQAGSGANAVLAARAMTARFCPEYLSEFE